MKDRRNYDHSQKKDLIARLEKEAAGENADLGDVPSESADSDMALIEETDAKSASRPLIFRRYVAIGVSILIMVVAGWLSWNQRTSNNDHISARYVGTLPTEGASWATELENPFPIRRCFLSGETDEALSADAYTAVFVTSGQVAFIKDGRDHVSVASIIKLLGALVVVEDYDLDSSIALREEVDSEGSGMDLLVGEAMSVRDLLGAALVGSKNDAMFAIAQNYPGGVDGFVAAMNQKAVDLGMEHTSVANPVGYDDPDQRSTLGDLVILTVAAIRDETVAEILKSESWEVVTDAGTHESVSTTNMLLERIPGILGGKTGYTTDAGLSLVEYVHDTQDFVTIVLNANDRYQETIDLIQLVRETYVCE